jgi:surface protein
MRNLITKYTFIPGSRTITLPDFANLAESNPSGVENIRLIVNETQKVVVCSSMQKDNVSVVGNTITYTDSLAPLNYGDQLTIEVDMGDGILTYGGTDWIIEAKRDAIENGSAAQDLIITRELGEQLKPLAEVDGGSSIAMYSLCGALANCATTEVDLSSWERITTYYGCYYMFSKNTRLRKVDLSSLRTISSENAAASMFSGCYALQSVDLSSLRTINGSSAVSGMFSGCSALQSVDLRNLQTVSGSNMFTLAFQNCNAFREIRIGCGAISSSNVQTNILLNTPYIRDLYLYGDAFNNINVSYLDLLNFNSVCGVLKKLCKNTEASGLVCSFKSNFNIDDKTEWTYTDGDGNTEVINNPNGILKGLREQATSQGWTIQNLTING